ncbi:hypothetical protein DFQ26_001470, partial [Actinomortierella ambigua]
MRNPLSGAFSHVMAPVSSLSETYMGQILASATSNAPVRSQDVARKTGMQTICPMAVWSKNV